MNDALTTQLRKTLIDLLDDENGVNAKGYEELQSLVIQLGQDAVGVGTGDIFNAVQSANGRYYLPEDHELVP